MAEILGSEPALFGKAGGREVIEIAVGRSLADLNKAFRDTAFEIGIGQAQGDAEMAGEMALAHVLLSVYDVENLERQRVFPVAFCVHIMNTIPYIPCGSRLKRGVFNGLRRYVAVRHYPRSSWLPGISSKTTTRSRLERASSPHHIPWKKTQTTLDRKSTSLE